MPDADIVIAGAGVVGLAIASRLASPSRRVFILEKNFSFGQETSSHNSGVIHSGIYYPENSLKARMCTRGRELLYEICRTRGVPCLKPGKIIVATGEDEIGQLEALFNQGMANGVTDLKLLSRRQLRTLEPNVEGSGALLSPSTGIIEPFALMNCFLQQAREGGAVFAFRTEVTGLEKSADGFTVSVKDSQGSFTFDTHVFINSCGLYSDRTAELAGIDIDSAKYRIHYCKGHYFMLKHRGPPPVSRPVYPVPETDGAGLGIHITPDIEGNIRLGPDALYVSSISYGVADSGREAFWKSARRLVPGIDINELFPDFAGIRPKLQAEGEGFRDFVITNERERGLPGLINLLGIESPGLTSAPAIAEYISGII
ncbi:MAG: NAD(P)/FAD-dependent oxidoreductase [Dehalococcoidia bacterium]|nr:NAD(P)/FAD-dependent oxidoreductase [Dehalococcoidia bacterium]MDZ4247023.1 NAD(P)/FAD-dependent oxidoreductase [Dehalococcoidia bacterium]